VFWFDGSRISGYALNKVVSEDFVPGAWWYAEDVPTEIFNDVSRINMTLPRKNEITFHRSPEEKKFPNWAEDYFREGLYKRESAN